MNSDSRSVSSEMPLQSSPVDMVDDEIDLREFLATLIESRWLIIFVMSIVAFAGASYALLATPIYSGDVLLQVESKSQGMSGLEDLTSLFTGETPAEAEIEIIRSRSIIGAAVDQLHLDIDAKPRYVPVIGAAIARYFHKSGGVEAPWWNMNRYAWGGERITVERLVVPDAYVDEPLTLVALDNGAFSLRGVNGESLLEGMTGQTAAANGLEIFVTELVARPGTDFRVTKRRHTQTINDLQGDLKVAEKGKKTGVIQLTLEGPHRDVITRTLDTISQLYLKQNVERRSEEAAKTLEFLQNQLPQVKGNLDAAEDRLNTYQSNRGSIDLPLETQAVLQKLAEVEKSLSEVELKRKELSQKFTDNHPSVVTLNRQREQFEAQRVELDTQIKSMPEEVQESVRLARDVKVANEIYLLMLQKAQEMNVIKAGTIGNVRILDTALVGDRAVKPKKVLVLALSVVLGALLGAVLAFVLKSLRRGVEDPDQLEQRTGLPVYASIPHSAKQTELTKKTRKGEKFGRLLALEDNKDLAIESLRSLRTSLQFASMDAKNNVVAISGPSPGLGKSFISANLAYLLADAGKRVLLVDADMRKGHLHEYFHIKRGKGLSGAITGEVKPEEATHATEVANLDFVPSGTVPPNPSELLMSERFQKLIQQYSERYDLVLIDTPPALAVTDATIVGRLASINFLVVRHGIHPMREIEEALKRFHRAGVKPKGFVFNDIPRSARAYGYGKYSKYAYHYQYEYK